MRMSRNVSAARWFLRFPPPCYTSHNHSKSQMNWMHVNRLMAAYQLLHKPLSQYCYTALVG